jgi:hypothetical protein
MLRMKQVCNVVTHTERGCIRISPRKPKAIEIGYSPARYLIQNHVCTVISIICGREERRRLALDDNYNTGYPYNGCDGHDKLISVPNGDAGSLDERFIWKKMRLGRMECKD